MERRLAILGDNERELDDIVLRDAEAFLDTKIALEESIKVVSDQIQYLDSVQQVMNGLRLGGEINYKNEGTNFGYMYNACTPSS